MTTNPTEKMQRRWDIDWLRVGAVLLLLYYHPARIYYAWGGWYIENVQKSTAISISIDFIDRWHMPLLFLLAGASTFFALRFRSAGQYVVERFKRLLVPLVVGLLLIIPPQIYIQVLYQRRFPSLSYLAYYPDYFTGRYSNGFDMGQLWFIFFLFLFSLVALPLFLFLKNDRGQRALQKIGKFFALPGMIYLPIAFIVLANYLMLDSYPNPIYFLTFFILGYILVASEHIQEAIDRHKLFALILGVGGYGVWISLVLSGVINWNLLRPIPHDVFGWSCLITLLGYGKQFLNTFNAQRWSGKILKYAGEASYPIYILHQTVIIAIAYFVVPWTMAIGLELAMIVISSLVVTVVIYDLLVKRTNVTRFLFGMKPLKKAVSSPAPDKVMQSTT